MATLILPQDVAVFDRVRVFKSGAQTITTGTGTVLLFDSESFDSNSMHSTVSNTGRLTCVTTGVYRIYGLARWGTESATGITEATFRINGTTSILATDFSATTTYNLAHCMYTEYALTAGDYVEFLVQQNSGGDKTITSAFTSFGMTLTV